MVHDATGSGLILLVIFLNGHPRTTGTTASAIASRAVIDALFKSA